MQYFSDESPLGKVKGNEFRSVLADNGIIKYRLKLDQTVPSGDKLKGDLTFESRTVGPFSSVRGGVHEA